MIFDGDNIMECLDIILENDSILLNENLVKMYINKIKNIKSIGTFKSIHDKTKKKAKFISNALSNTTDRGSEVNSEDIKKTIKNTVMKHKTSIQNAIKDKNVKKLEETVSTAAKETNTKIRGLFDLDIKLPLNVIYSIILLSALTFLNLLFVIVFSYITGDVRSGIMIAMVVSAPFIGELGKHISIKSNYATEFLAMSSIGGFYTYLFSMIYMGANPWDALIVRLLALIGQYGVAKVHKSYIENKDGGTGFFLSSMLHAIINAAMVLVVDTPLMSLSKGV